MSRRRSVTERVLGFVLLWAALACAGAAEPIADARRAELQESFAAFGGRPGLEALVADLLPRLQADPRIGAFFEVVAPKRFKRNLTDQFCMLLAGDCVYRGRDMRNTHAEVVITAAHFNALVEDLQDAMEARGIPYRHQRRLLAQLAPLQREIVNDDWPLEERFK